jgi:hypothetical protein
LNPKLRLLGDTLTEWLCPRIDPALRVWFDPYCPRDFEAELKRYDLLARYGAIELNELRQWAGLPPMDYGDVATTAPAAIDDAIAGIVDARFASIGADVTFNGKRNGHDILTN